MVDLIKRSREVQQREHRQVAVIERLEYVRQYFNNCCLCGVVRSVSRLQVWKHLRRVEIV